MDWEEAKLQGPVQRLDSKEAEDRGEEGEAEEEVAVEVMEATDNDEDALILILSFISRMCIRLKGMAFGLGTEKISKSGSNTLDMGGSDLACSI